MKIITISRIGYNHPSQANWSYGIFKVDTIDTNGYEYQMSYTVKEAFGGDSRFRDAMRKLKIKVIETKGVLGTPKISGARTMQDIESEEFIKEITEWYNKK